MIAPEMVKLELSRLSTILNDRIDRKKNELSSKRRLIIDLIDIGFKKISDTKYSFDITNRDKAYITFMVNFRGKAVDIHEDHIVIKDKHEVTVSSLGKQFSLYSVRYGKATEAIYNRVIELSKELSEN